uniref:Autophagy-related protein 11 C-terminal domain-containing protein n=1 Tax=Globodera rostochiensis TaxID=31243 RepID=A0A914H1L3_GLORO
MFHIFYVNRGYMLVLEPPALGSVYDLQKCIAGSINVDINEQYLFLSGGASINRNAMLSAISDVGTDTNPIFLVRRVTNVQPESTKTNADGINDIYQDWELSMDRMLGIVSTNSSSAISECVDLGRKCAHLAENIVRFCSNVLVEHRFLYQGWMSVISNLDENILRIQRRLDKSLGQAIKLETYRQKGRCLMNGFDKVLEILRKIVIPPSLLLPAHSSANLSDSEGSVEEITLFDWISSKDPAYSLTSFSQHVLEHLEKTTNEELSEAQNLLAMVQDVAQKTQYRDIRGIDKRLATLNAHLLKLEGSLTEVRETTAAIIQPIIQDGTQNVVVGQKNRLKELKGKLSEQRNCALSFINSKDEVIQNICQRLATWIRQAYQRLQDVDKRVMCFDQKFGGLRQRMDLARQITETPSIYMTAVPEVIRREALKKEFAEWMGLHIAKTSEFIAEENKIRQHFFGKLDRHFLRQLFPGMDDVIPQFSPKTTPKIDELLPKVHFSHLHELRSRFPEMKELLVVGAPNLVSRLAIFDPSLPSPMATLSSRSMRREESFYVRDKTSNIDAMNRNFPSTNWLSEESMGLSPSPSGASNFLSMEQRGGAFSTSSASIHSISGMELQSPQELGPLGVHFDASVNTSETTNKNTRSSMSPLQPSAPIAIPSNSQSNPVDPMESLGSNQFSTPDDTFGSLGSTCGGRFVNVKQPYRPTSPKVVRPKSMLRYQMCSQLVHKEEDEKHYNDQEMEIQKEKSAQTNHKFHSKLVYALTGLKELSEEISSVRQNTEELGKAVVVCLSKPEIITSEEKCLQKIAEIERKCNSQIMDITNELQRERSLLIEKENAIKEQNEVVSRITNDLKVLTRERDQLLEKVKRDGEQRQQKNVTAEMEETDTQPIAIEEISTKEPLVAPLSSNSGSDEDEGVAQLSTRSYGTQTKIRGKDMQTFISLNELYEGCGALIIWNSHLNAYVARSTSSPNSPYIVKDSSFEKLGIRRPPRPIQATDENSAVFSHSVSMPRPWMFVLVESIEMCQIRKATNRYNLPLDTRFYRISVLPILGDFVTAVPMSTTSSVSSSNARK